MYLNLNKVRISKGNNKFNVKYLIVSKKLQKYNKKEKPLLQKSKYNFLAHINFSLNIEYLFFLKHNLYSEWKIWSQCFGKVVIINGTSSSGKTTLSKYINKFGFNIINSDDTYDELLFNYLSKSVSDMPLLKTFLNSIDLISIMYGYKIQERKYSEKQIKIIKIIQDSINLLILNSRYPVITKKELYDSMYEKSKKYVFSGQNVLLDLVARDEDTINMLRYSFNSYPLKTCLLYSNLAENLKKCFLRNYISLKNDEANFRNCSMIMSQYKDLYKFKLKQDISSTDIVLEKIDKKEILNILDIAIFHEHNLICDLQSKLINPRLKETQGKDLVKGMVGMLRDKMMLEVCEEVFVISSIKYDVLLKSSNLEKINDSLAIKEIFFIPTIQESDICSLRSSRLTVLQNYNRDDCDARSCYSGNGESRSDLVLLSPTMTILTNNRFIIFFKQSSILPRIIGNNGPVIELEYDTTDYSFKLLRNSGVQSYDKFDYSIEDILIYHDYLLLTGELGFY